MTFSWAPDLAASAVLIFARVGMLVMLLPSLGEQAVPTRIRLSIALLFVLVMMPAVQPLLPQSFPGGLPQLIRILFAELAVGGVLGLAARMLMSGLQTAGAVVAQQLGLGFSTIIDPSLGQQGALIGGFLTMCAIALIFATDTHHLAIAAIGQSYRNFPPGNLPPIGDSAALVLQYAASAFKIAIQISAPLLVFGLVFNIGLGVLARLMPQMQVFFIAMPASILLGFLLFGVLIGSMMLLFLEDLREGLGQLSGL